METTNYGGGLIQFTLFIGFIIILIIPAIFFLITQQNTLKAIQPENRTMSPGEVWLQLIPLFNLIWQFFVVARISDSLEKELHSWKSDTVFSAQRSEMINTNYSRPTYGVGLAMCICVSCSIIPCLGYLAALGALVCWIIYWVQLAEFKRKIQTRFY